MTDNTSTQEHWDYVCPDGDVVRFSKDIPETVENKKLALDDWLHNKTSGYQLQHSKALYEIMTGKKYE